MATNSRINRVLMLNCLLASRDFARLIHSDVSILIKAPRKPSEVTHQKRQEILRISGIHFVTTGCVR